MTFKFRFLPAALAICLAATTAAEADDQSLNDIFGLRVEKQAAGALAMLGFAAVPSETASALQLDTHSNPNRGYDFEAAQLGGGFRWSESVPIWLEGYIGYNRYDPVLLLGDKGTTSRLPLKWTSAVATGGIGYEFDLSPYLVLRPQLHLSVGRVQTDVSVAAKKIGNILGVDVESLEAGGMWAGGYGGSLSLVYNRRWENDYEVDLSLRHTQIHLVPIAGNKDIQAESDAIATTLWTRLRVPTGYQLFDRPVRLVGEAAMSHLPGDQGEVLNENWLGQIGAGGEIDFAETWVPWITTTRLMVRYMRGERVEGISIGLAASF